ncbi:MAG: hypothetical protein P4L84_34905 [Isosphaeraceae bacterium]|nr:hypothetical protein [Isosphaeraceae bacterium]
MATAPALVPQHSPPATLPGPGRIQLGGAGAMQQTIEDINQVREFVGRELKQDLDYGVIPGTSKPTLLLPGSQKILMYFNCYPDYEISTEHFEGGHVEHIVKTVLRSRTSQSIIGIGVGSASSLESKYRWRHAERECPECGKAAIIKGKEEYGGGWVCFKKKGGCNAKFQDDDRRITAQNVGRVENPDIHDVRNTVLKIAKKRSLVDASLGLSCLSEHFTQDLDEYPPLGATPAESADSRPADPQRTPPQAQGQREGQRPSGQRQQQRQNRREDNRSAEPAKQQRAPQAESWATWIVRELNSRNTEFGNEQSMAKVEPQKRVKEVMNQFEAANLVASECLRQGIIQPAQIAQEKDASKRSRTKVLEFVARYFHQYPDWVKDTVLDRFREKQDEHARRLGVYNPDAEPVDQGDDSVPY